MPSRTPPPDPRTLAERVRPSSLRDLVGNPQAVDALRSWAKGWQQPGRRPRFRAAILEGPPGVGKTTAAEALARDLGWGLVEMNASDARNRAAIERVAGRAAVSNGFSESGELLDGRRGRHLLILLDEADCLFARDTDATAAAPAPTPSLREFLRARYGSVEALAAAWGLGRPGAPPPFASWEAVPATSTRGAAFRLPAAARDAADWSQSRSRPDLTDRGGLGAIAQLVRDTRQPIVLTVNDPRALARYSPVFRFAATRIRFHPLREEDVRGVVRRVALGQHIALATTALDALVRRSQGDLRAALNDLDALSAVPPGPGQDALLGARDLPSDFYEITHEIFEHPRVYRSVEIRNRLDATPDDLIGWVEENLPRATRDPAPRLRGFSRLAESDLLLSRARRYRVYGLWSYASELLTGGVGLALAGPGSVPPEPVAFPQAIAEMGRTRLLRATRASVLAKAGRMLHTSRRKSVEAWWPFLETVFRPAVPEGKRKERLALLGRLVPALGLSAEEVALLSRAGPGDPAVVELLPAPEPTEEAGESSGGGPEEAPGRPPAEPAPPPAAAPEPSPERTERKRVQRRLAEF